MYTVGQNKSLQELQYHQLSYATSITFVPGGPVVPDLRVHDARGRAPRGLNGGQDPSRPCPRQRPRWVCISAVLGLVAPPRVSPSATDSTHCIQGSVSGWRHRALLPVAQRQRFWCSNGEKAVALSNRNPLLAPPPPLSKFETVYSYKVPTRAIEYGFAAQI